MNTNISAGTIARMICLILALVNQVLVMTGHSVLPIEDQTIELIVTNVWTVVAALWGYWKNNSWTLKARKADVYLARKKEKL
ncbi:MAG TPA: phage holin [Candidatus Faecalibacterium intestinigallinarum]|uniref:Phage holin n=1 Tax=Candidatus Faecalibacterium intestinigallinarum TaxID=2838581 RepID=A0A9D1Q980_9FIRM|nr:phage holin [Candidatus Faecalibacterium intestinigallinarum]